MCVNVQLSQTDKRASMDRPVWRVTKCCFSNFYISVAKFNLADFLFLRYESEMTIINHMTKLVQYIYSHREK